MFETKDLIDIIKNDNISPGEYTCEKALNIINKTLLKIDKEIKLLIKQFGKEKLNLLLDLYSNVLCNMQEIYKGSNKKDKKLLDERERMNTCIFAINKLIIDNIDINDNKDDNDINNQDIDFIIKKSNDYTILKSYCDIIDTIIICKDYMPQDICDYIKLIIEKDFSLKICENDNFSKYDEEILFDKYNNHNFNFKPNKESCELFAKSFKKDTKFDFNDFLAVLYYMGNIIIDEYKHIHVHENKNIISIPRMELITILSNIKDINSFKNDINFFNLLNIKKNKINKNNINKIVDFIINEYKNSLVININDKIMFSPLCIKHYYKLWDNAVNDFDIPSHCKMENTDKALEKIKKEYEERIENDVNKLISGYHFTTKQNLKLAINNRKKDNYYQELGEFDVVGINVNKRKILLIECKFIKNDNTPRSFIYRYKNFFGVKKYHEKFKRRIDYVRNNQQDFLQFYFNNIDTSINYDIESYMVINRPFAQKFHNFNDFKIVSFYKFKEICKKL